MPARLKVYLGGPTRELGRVGFYADKLVDSGLVDVVHEWWASFAAEGSDDALIHRSVQAEYARTARHHILGADLFWGLWPTTRSEGVPCEMTIAAEHGVPVVLSGRLVTGCIFTASSAFFRDTSDDVGLTEVLRRARAAMAAQGGST